MTALTNRSLLALATLALGACTPGGAAARTDAEPQLAHRAATKAATASPLVTVRQQPAEHGPNAGSAVAALVATSPVSTSPVGAAKDGVAAPTAEPSPVAGAEDEGQPGRATQILRRVEQAAAGVRTLQADFTQRLHVALLDQDQQSSGRLYQKRPDRFLMRFTNPAGDVMVADGRHFWIYYPSTDRKQVIRTSLARGAGQVDLQRQFLGNATSRFTAVQGADESVGGRPAYVLTLTPRGASDFRRLKIWADKGDYLVRRFEVTEQNESVRRIDLRNLRVNAPVSDALFRFTPPAGAQVFDQ
jgi:outer membrane lipoprotein carrier protein